MERNKKLFWFALGLGVLAIVALWVFIPNTYTFGVLCLIAGLLGVFGGIVYRNRPLRIASIIFLIISVGGGSVFMFLLSHSNM